MKNQKFIIVSLGALLATAFFYRQGVGANLILFSLLVTVLQIVTRKEIIYNISWVLVSIGTFLASLGYNFTNLYLTFILYIASMSVSIYLHSVRADFWPFAPIHIFINLFRQPVRWFRSLENSNQEDKNLEADNLAEDQIAVPIISADSDLFNHLKPDTLEDSIKDLVPEIEFIGSNKWTYSESSEDKNDLQNMEEAAFGDQFAEHEPLEEVVVDYPMPKIGVMRFRKIIFPILFFITFISLYGIANQGFGNLVVSIADVISFSLMVFLAGSFIWMITALYSEGSSVLANWEIDLKDSWSLSVFLKESDVTPLLHKQKEAFISLIGLIIILSVLLVFEVESIWHPSLDKNMADGLHENIFAVIFSIVLAAIVTIYYFSGNVFFMTKINNVKKIIFTWLFLNGILAAIGIYKTFIYISIYGLTYKRLSVIEYLTTIITGLIIIGWCIYYRKGNWKLVNLIVGFTYGYLILFTLPNWDRIMVRYNFTMFPSHDPIYYEKLSVSGFGEYLNLENPNMPYFDPNLESKIRNFKALYKETGPLGKTFEDNMTIKDLQKASSAIKK